MKESNRQLKVGKLIQKDLGDIFQKDAKGLFGKAFITVTAVKMSPDLSMARVYLSFLMVDDQNELINDISRKKSEIRRILGNKIGKQVRIVPDLMFYLDDTASYASKIDEILSGLDIPEDDKSDN